LEAPYGEVARGWGLVERRRRLAQHGVGRGEYEALDAGVPRRLEQVHRVPHVGLEGADRVGDGVGDPSAGGEVDDAGHAIEAPASRSPSSIRTWNILVVDAPE
jgi:hypothetical protein